MKDFKTFVTTGYRIMMIKEDIANGIVRVLKENNSPMRVTEIAEALVEDPKAGDYTVQKYSAILRQMCGNGITKREEIDTGKTFECKYFDHKTQTIKTYEKPIIHAYFSLK